MQVEFYDKRYQEGYMEAWDKGKIEKIKDTLRSMSLPSAGKALDFGCGNGVLTGILKEILPDWEIWGTDISETALQNARKRLPTCHFLSFKDRTNHLCTFDLIFSHHVLEHVDRIDDCFLELNSFSGAKATQLHILPCGNESSLEYIISSLTKDGIERNKEDRFFFEEPGHLRRLTSKAFEDKMKPFGFSLNKAFYSNQYWGAINWITKSSPRFVKKLTDPRQAIDKEASTYLKQMRSKLLPLSYVQHALVLFLLYWNRFNRKPKEAFLMLILSIPAIVSWPFYTYLDWKANKEWAEQKLNPNGSEMFLVFNR